MKTSRWYALAALAGGVLAAITMWPKKAKASLPSHDAPAKAPKASTADVPAAKPPPAPAQQPATMPGVTFDVPGTAPATMPGVTFDVPGVPQAAFSPFGPLSTVLDMIKGAK